MSRSVSRRRFLKAAGAAAAAPTAGAVTAGALAAAPADGAASAAAAVPAAGAVAAVAAAAAQGAGRRSRRAAFAPSSQLQKISDNLYCLEDTCNVYLIRDGSRAILIDFGSGKILDSLPQLGVTRVDWVLHTHHHRDQCQGDHLAVERSIPVAVPAHERHLFEGAENFWKNRRIFELYYVRNDFYTLTENVPVAALLADYSNFRWNNRDIFVLPTPGHTPGAVTLVATVDGKKVAFTGDLMHSPGKVHTLYDMQYNYGGSEGVDLAVFSLSRLRELKPELLCPSHGAPLPDPDAGIGQTIDRLSEYYQFETGGQHPTESARGYAVSPHFVAHNLTTSSFYALISDSGKAMFIDYGSASGTFFNSFEVAAPVNDRMRFVEHNIDNLKARHGLKSVDVAMPSHMHDDHQNGFPHLIRHHGTRVWCYENMVDIFENPRGHNLGCTLGEPFKVERSFRHGEKFKWEEFEFEMTHSPGHTEYQMALFATIDGARVAFTGDAFFTNPTAPMSDGALRHNLIFRNHVESDSHLKSIHNILDHEPNLIAPGHGKPFLVNRSDLLATEAKLRKQKDLFEELVADRDTNFGMDPSWVKIYPYQMVIKPGETARGEVRVQNYRAAPMKVEVALVLPEGWRAEPEVLRFEAPARGHASSGFLLKTTRELPHGQDRVAIAADVVSDGRYLGQITEAVVDLPAEGGPPLAAEHRA